MRGDHAHRLTQPTQHFLQVVESELLLKTLLDDGPQGLAHRVLDKAGVDVSKLSTDLDSYL